MSWRTNALVVGARSVGRTLGLNRWIASWRSTVGYEARYDKRFSEVLRPGDCVWDVGANVGYYTRLFSERITDRGMVCAFEPSPVNFARLSGACIGLGNVRMLQVGLGRENGRLFFQQGADELGATSRVIGNAPGGEAVDIRTGRSLINDGDAPTPDAIKIDVEGYEYEVLDGLGEYLGAPSLRAIGVEVHFGILKERGMDNTPKQIEELLARHGFVVDWPDSSHILATRRGR